MAGIAFLTLWAAGPVWFVIYDFTGRKAWQKYSDAEKARGVKLYIAEFTPPSVPDEENFGALPIFRNTLAINRRLPELPPSGKFYTGFAEPEPGFSFEPERWRDRFARAGWIDTPSADVGADLRLALVRYDDALTELAEGLKRPHCSFGITWASNPYKTSFPYVRTCQYAALIAMLRANAHLASGHSEAALQDLRFVCMLRNRLAQEPTTLPAAVRTAMGRQQVSIIHEGLSRHAWNAAQLREIIGLLGELGPLDDMAFWIKSERTMINDLSEWLLHGNIPMANERWDTDPYRFFQNAKVLRSFSGIVRRNQMVVNRTHDRFLGGLDPANGIDRNGGNSCDLPDSPYYVLARLTLLGFDSCRENFLALATNFQLARTACALELYRIQHAWYPQTLTELVPAYLPSLPNEPMSSDLLVYYPTDDGRYRLYSRGFNQEDENGILRRYKVGRWDYNFFRVYKYLSDVPWTAPPPR